MLLRERFGGPGFALCGFRRQALDHPPQGPGASQSVALGHLGSPLDVAGLVAPRQVDEAVHAALTAAAFFLNHFSHSSKAFGPMRSAWANSRSVSREGLKIRSAGSIISEPDRPLLGWRRRISMRSGSRISI